MCEYVKVNGIEGFCEVQRGNDGSVVWFAHVETG